MEKKRRYFPDEFNRQAAVRVETSGLSILDVSELRRKRIQRGVHRSVAELGADITACNKTLNENPRSLTTKPVTIQPPPARAMNGVARAGSFFA